MRLLFITQVYQLDHAGMFGALVRSMKESGWSVTVVAGDPPERYDQGDRSSHPKKLWVRESVDGVEVLRVWHPKRPGGSIYGRLAGTAVESLGASIGALFTQRPDVVMVYGPPLIGPSLGWAVAKRHGARLVNLIFDIYPDIAVETGYIENPGVIAAARAAERFQYLAADMTIVLSHGFKEALIDRGVPDEKIEVVPIWFDPAEVEPRGAGREWRREQGIPEGKLVVMFSGTVGLVSGATVIADTARLMSNRRDIMFVVVGDGRLKPALVKRANDLETGNLIFLPFQPREKLSEQLAAADICLVTLGPGRGRTSFPSKMLAYMAAGRPVLASVDPDCDLAEEVLEGDFGLVVRPGDPRALADGVEKLASSPEDRARYGGAARSRLESHFAQEIVLPKLERVLRAVVKE